VASNPEIPPLVVDALDLAQAIGFEHSCRTEVGSLLRVLAASRPGARFGETGTGCGVGSAWLASGMDAESSLVTVERDATLASRARGLLDQAANVTVIEGDWKALAEHAPYDVLFLDGGGKRDEREAAIEMVAAGGLIVMDDFVPATEWPPLFENRVDELRVWWLTHPALTATEVAVSPDMAVILAAKRNA
jgi:predicted O-methyltransferase YrrM